jgi:hypothetical protein
MTDLERFEQFFNRHGFETYVWGSEYLGEQYMDFHENEKYHKVSSGDLIFVFDMDGKFKYLEVVGD